MGRTIAPYNHSVNLSSVPPAEKATRNRPSAQRKAFPYEVYITEVDGFVQSNVVFGNKKSEYPEGYSDGPLIDCKSEHRTGPRKGKYYPFVDSVSSSMAGLR